MTKTIPIMSFWPVAVGLAINALIFAMGWNDGDANASPWLPPGWIIGVVWLVLLGLMSDAFAQLAQRHACRAAGWTLALIVSCLLYPFYAIAPDSAALGYLGSLVSIAVAIVAIARARRHSLRAAFALLPTPLWIAYANAAMLLANA